ncbi:MAG TPA: hypothetical protein VFA85_17725 [Terriglobales bacterium]|nr:hypothetical protein [Terriglobales bacterium]
MRNALRAVVFATLFARSICLQAEVIVIHPQGPVTVGDNATIGLLYRPTPKRLLYKAGRHTRIVPVSSQLGGTSSTLVFSNNAGSGFGVIHSPGIELLNFLGPSEVDPASRIPDEVISLLNEQTNGPDFF